MSVLIKSTVSLLGVLSLAGCLGGGSAPEDAASFGPKLTDLQNELVDDVGSANIAAALAKRCSSFRFDDDANDELTQSFAVQLFGLAAREKRSAKWVDKTLNATSKLRKSQATRNKVANKTKAYWDRNFTVETTQDEYCAIAASENNSNSDVGRFLKRKT